ncbi:MAG TPA: glycoside hydrolase family 3 N-terminal domain-containing protein [Thermoanaerobaculia bacterium]|nr:glycoside hydrolase family 3 N-terminal domain-containing protein [Thermoanaerobaculia bacterium]
MTAGASRLFGVGVSGPALLAEERAILDESPPSAVILFRRNIESAGELARLVDDVRALPGRPLLLVDQEGGPVDRLRDLAGPFPSFHAAARAGVARRAGDLAGRACALLGFDVDLAPVVDRRLPGAGESVLGERVAAPDPDEVAAAARDFLDGLHAHGVGGCLKHFPGLGRARFDTHKDLPALPDDPSQLEEDLRPFRALGDVAGAIMVSHAASAGNGIPASLSPEIATRLLREGLGFPGVALSDDLEMGALARFGGLPERAAAAASAGCDLVFVCSRIEEYPACVEAVRRAVSPERRDEALRRVEAYRERLDGLRRAAPAPCGSLEELRRDVAELLELIESR